VKEAVEAFSVYAADADKATTPLSSLQARLARWQNINFGAVGLEQQALGVAEESGELCHAVLKSMQKIRGFDDRDKLRDAAGDAIADCTIYLMQAATALRLDFETLLKLTAEKVMQRDWVTNPNDADRVIAGALARTAELRKAERAGEDIGDLR
jgi:NTP pyrophosphatase (non-canonical NTP hydrolase)